jgi:hypothetical protein
MIIMAHSRPHTLPSGVIQRGIVLTDVEAIWGFDRASLFHQGVQKNLQQRRPLKKGSILFKVKNGENFNRRNTRQVFRGLKSKSDSEIGQKGAFFKGLKREVRDI